MVGREEIQQSLDDLDVIHEEIHSGTDTVYKVSWNGEHAAIKIHTYQTIPASYFRSEGNILSYLESTSVPTPSVFDVGKIGDKDYIVTGWVDSSSKTVEELSRIELEKYIGNYHDTIHNIKSISVPETRFYGSIKNITFDSISFNHKYNYWQNWFFERTNEYLDSAKECIYFEDELIRQIRAIYENNIDTVPKSPPPKILHNDYGPRNLVTDNLEILSVIDWSQTLIGDGEFFVQKAKCQLAIQSVSNDDFDIIESIFGHVNSLKKYLYALHRHVIEMAVFEHFYEQCTEKEKQKHAMEITAQVEKMVEEISSNYT